MVQPPQELSHGVALTAQSHRLVDDRLLVYVEGDLGRAQGDGVTVEGELGCPGAQLVFQSDHFGDGQLSVESTELEARHLHPAQDLTGGDPAADSVRAEGETVQACDHDEGREQWMYAEDGGVLFHQDWAAPNRPASLERRW